MTEPIDYDGAWKETLEHYLQPFLVLCFPLAAAGIDWAVPIEFLDQELQQVVRDADLGKQRTDKLVKVRRRDGGEEWVLIHVEVQAQSDPDLALRMYRYHHRIADRYGRSVASLAVLADADPQWRPGPYAEALWGCRLRFEYLTCKLLDCNRPAKPCGAHGASASCAGRANRPTAELRVGRIQPLGLGSGLLGAKVSFHPLGVRCQMSLLGWLPAIDPRPGARRFEPRRCRDEYAPCTPHATDTEP